MINFVIFCVELLREVIWDDELGYGEILIFGLSYVVELGEVVVMVLGGIVF